MNDHACPASTFFTLLAASQKRHTHFLQPSVAEFVGVTSNGFAASLSLSVLKSMPRTDAQKIDAHFAGLHRKFPDKGFITWQQCEDHHMTNLDAFRAFRTWFLKSWEGGLKQKLWDMVGSKRIVQLTRWHLELTKDELKVRHHASHPALALIYSLILSRRRSSLAQGQPQGRSVLGWKNYS
jgi:hypothetical protein